MEPCLMCFGAILISGIHRIVYAYEDVMGGGTGCDLSRLPALYSGTPVEIVPHLMRDRSLALFKTFFSRPDNLYWKHSALADYTLAQPL
jgi:tRNA(adenine34) deaminase